MDRKTWLKKASTLKLTESLHLCRADAPEWERYVHVYYHQATIAFRCREKENFLSGGDEPFWLVKDQTVVGGLALSPWAFRYFFTVPPFEGGAEVIRLIAQTLRRQGGNGLPIQAMEVPDVDADDYIRAGFRPDPCRFRWMRRPTAVFEGEHPEMIWRRAETACDSGETRLKLEREAGLFLFKHAQGGESGERGAMSFPETLLRLREFAAQSPEAVLEASGAAYDRATHALIGVCLIGYSEGCPVIEALAVRPGFRGKGVATNMLRRALTALAHRGEPMLRARIAHGHPLESLCHRLGFMPGPLFWPAMTFDR